MWIHCMLVFPPSTGLNIPFLILWIEREILSRLSHVFSWLTTEICTEIIKRVLFNFLFKFNSNISESALMMGKSGLLENSVFWRRRGARNPCRLKTCGWGEVGEDTGIEEMNQKTRNTPYLVCLGGDEQAAQHPGRLCASWFFQAGEVQPPLRSHGSLHSGSLHSAAFSNCLFPLSLPT